MRDISVSKTRILAWAHGWMPFTKIKNTREGADLANESGEFSLNILNLRCQLDI